MLEKIILKRNLSRPDIYIEDSDATSKYFEVLESPQVLPPGRSSILINGSPFLKKGTEILAELLDSEGKPIYINAIANLLEGTARRIGIEVYQNTAPGRAVLTILGEIDPAEVDFVIPEEFQGVYNVRYQKVLSVNPNVNNTEPIRFLHRPQMAVEEIIMSQLTPKEGLFGVDIVKSGSMYGKRVPYGEQQVLNAANIERVSAVLSPVVQEGFHTEGTIYNRIFPVKLSSGASNGMIVRRIYSWGDGSTVSDPSVNPAAIGISGQYQQSHEYKKAGTYTARVAVTSPTGQHDESTQLINISKPQPPVANYSLSQITGSINGEIIFSDLTQNVANNIDSSTYSDGSGSSVDTEYSWSFGDGTESSLIGQNNSGTSLPISHYYQQTGSYLTRLEVHNDYRRQQSFTEKPILILPPDPAANFSIDVSQGEFPLTITVSSTTESGSAPTHTLGTPTTSTPADIQAVSMSLEWNFGDGNSAGGDNASHTFGISGGSPSSDTTYNVSLKATDQYGRESTETKPVEVTFAAPRADFTQSFAYDTTFPITATFTAQATGSNSTGRDWTAGTFLDSTSYYWTFPGGSPARSTTANPTISYPSPNSGNTGWPVTLKIVSTGTAANGNRKTETVTKESLVQVDLPSAPVADFETSRTKGFVPLTVNFANTSQKAAAQNLTYSWDFGDGSGSVAANPTHIFTTVATSGNRLAVLTATDQFGTVGTKTVNIETVSINPSSNWDLQGAETNLLQGGSRRFYDTTTTPAGSVIVSRQWSFAQGEISQTSAVQNPLITFSNAGDVNVSLTTTNSLGGTNTKTVQSYLIVGYDPPVASANLTATSGTTSVTTFYITDTSTTSHPEGIEAVTVNWGDETGNSTMGSGSTFRHTYETAGTYTPTIIAHDGAGSVTTSLSTVTISNPAGPTAIIQSVTSTTSGAPHYQQVQDNSTGIVSSRIWDWGDGTATSSSPNAGHVYKKAGTFTLELEVTGPGGQTSLAILSVVVEPEIVDKEADTTVEEEGKDNTDTSGDTKSGGGGGGGDGGGCVLEGTLILTDRGYIPVEEVKLNDKVISYDFGSEEFRDYEIKKAWNKLQPAWCFIETDLGFTLSCSDTHLIYHPDYKHNEITVRDLVVGEIIYVYKDGKLFKDNVRNITFFEQEKRVYNFSIDDVKSYISDGILSHNEEKDAGEGTDDWSFSYSKAFASPARITYEIYRPTGSIDDYGAFWEESMIGGTVTINTIANGITAYSNLPSPLNAASEEVLESNLYTVNSMPYIFKVLAVLRSGAEFGSQSIPSDFPGILYPDRGPIVTNTIFTPANGYSSDKSFLEYQDFGSAEVPIPFSIAYTKPVSMSYDIINKLSYAKINLSRLRTFSGQIHRVKLYYKSAGELGQYGVLYDGPITSTDTMVDELSITGRRRIGFFSDQATINKYWEAREGLNAGRYYGNYTGNIVTASLQGHSGSLTADDAIVMKGMLISGSNRGLNDVVTAYTKDIPGSSAIEGFNLARGVEYSLRAKIFGNKTSKEVENTTGGISIESKGQLEFYISGSATEEDTPYGKRLGFLEVGDDDYGTAYQDFGVVEHNFQVAKSGNFIIQLVAKSGEWQLRNIMIKPAREVGFSPDYIQLSAKVPPLTRRPDSLQFFAEFYDTNGNLAAKKSVSPAAIQFQGDNVVISGLDNVVSGSLNIGDAIGSGFEFYGGSSAYLRTIGYQGFTSASLGLAQSGFFMWSGSVLPDSNDSYGGVGMEMHAGLNSGSFRFRTYPRAEIDIRTDKFFFGSAGQHISGADGTIAISSSKFVLGSHTQFVSGADGNIEISSSNFHLSPTGDVTMKGKVTATSGEIGGWQLIQKEIEGTTRTLLSGSNATLDGTGAALYMSNKGPDTNKTDGYYIDFTPSDQSAGGERYFVRFGSNFAIRDDGQLFASGAQIEGILTASEGFIGGWTIGSSSLHKLTGTDYVGLSSTGDTRFFAGAPTLAQSGSGVFNVKADGTLTASNYLFAGSGLITGSVTIGASATILGDLSANTINTPAAGPYLATISSEGFAKFVSASIGGFNVDSVSISDSSNNLILSASGQITGSNVLFDGGKIGGWTIGSTLSSTNILLDPSTPRITLGSKGTLTDSNTGLYLGTDGVALGASSVFKVTSAGVITSTSGTIGGWTLASNSLSAGSTTTTIKLIPGTGIQMGHATFGSAPFSVTNAGVLKATSGTIGGFTLSSDSLTATNFTLSPSGKSITLGSGTDIFIVDGDVGLHLGHGTFASAPFSVTKAGVVKATSGTIGGFTLSANELTATNFELNPSNKFLSLGTGNTIFIADADTGIQLGHATFGSAPFSVTTAGVLKATSGTIGGWTLSSTTIVGTDVTLDSVGKIKVGTSDLSLSAGTGVFLSGSGEFRFGDASSYIKFQDDSFSIAGSDLEINVTDLNISASGFELSSPEASMSFGDHAIKLLGRNGGSIAMGSTVPTNLVSEGIFMSGSGEFNFQYDANNLIKRDGTTLSIKSATFDLDATSLIMDSAGDGGTGVIRLGSSGGPSSPTANTAGIYMDGGGALNIYGDANNYFRLDGGAFTIKSDTFDLDATTIKMDSAADNGTIALGATVNTSVAGTNAGIYMNGGGDFLVYADSSNYIRFDQDGTPKLDIKSSTFLLDTTNLDIDSTNKRIQFYDDSANEWVRIGETHNSAGTDKYGLKIFDGTGVDVDDDVIVMLGQEGNKIGGWEITGTQIRTIPSAGLGQNYGAGETGLILHSSGRMESSNFVTNLKGWRIDTLGNGTAEFENARIRGTLSTAVFEKETINAVGGQLLIANSSAITGSVSMSLTDTAFPVENVSGFAAGEIIAIKKVGPTGFSTEYVHVTGSYRRDSGSETDLSGLLHVTRAYGSNAPILSDSTTDLAVAITSPTETRIEIDDITKVVSLTAEGRVDGFGRQIKIDDERMRISGSEVGVNVLHVIRGLEGTAKAVHADAASIYLVDTDAEFLSGLVSVASTYEPGQVLVSTGRYISGEGENTIGTGYIKLNANPNDMSSPYIDIIERTGSGVYDVQLKARLGDLSGLSSGLVYGSSNPGFGLYSENVFLQGAIHAETGSFIGKVHINTDATSRMLLGTNVDSTNDGIHVGTHNYWYTTGDFKFGTNTDYIKKAGTALTIRSRSGDLHFGAVRVSGSLAGGFIKVGAVTDATTVATTKSGFYADNSGNVLIKGNVSNNNYIKMSGSGSIDIKAANFSLAAGSLILDSTTEKFKLGAVTNFARAGSAVGILMAKTGSETDPNANDYDFFIGKEDGNYMHWDASLAKLTVAGTINITAGSGFATTSDVSTAQTAAQDAAQIYATNAALSGSLYATDAAFSGSLYGASAVASASLYGAGAATSASNAYALAGVATGSAALAAALAGVATASALTAISDASDAQDAIDAMESQVVLSNTGMDLLTIGQSPNFTLATFGTTTKFFDGVASGSANVKLKLQAAGINLYGDTEWERVTVNSSGMTVYEDVSSVATERAAFGSDTVITGGTVTLRNSVNNNDKFVLTADSAKLYDNNVEVASFGATTTIGTTGSTGAYSEITSGTFSIKNNATTFLTADSSGISMVGSVTATAGFIGGFGISSDAIYSSNFFLSGSATGNDGTDNTNLFISSSRFKVTAGGDVTGSQVLFTGGKIAAFEFDENTFRHEYASSAGAKFTSSMEIGSVSNKPTVDINTDSNDETLRTKYFLEGTGGEIETYITAYSGSAGDNYSQEYTKLSRAYFYKSWGQRIPNAAAPYGYNDSSIFMLGGILANNHNVPIQQIYTHPDNQAITFFSNPTGGTQLKNIDTVTSGSINASGDYIRVGKGWMLGNKKEQPSFFVGDINDSYLMYSGSTDPLFEISSSNFHLSASGDVTMRGKITADTGAIGGFNIDAERLYIDAEHSSINITSSIDLYTNETSALPLFALFSRDEAGYGAGLSMAVKPASPYPETSVRLHIGFVENQGLNRPTNESFVNAADGFKFQVDSGSNPGRNMEAIFSMKGGIGGSEGGFLLKSTVTVGSDDRVQMQVGNTSNFIKFDSADATKTVHIKGDGVRIQTPQFLFGVSGSAPTTGAYISGSGGILSISSSNFFLAPNGDVTMTGTITATAGNIGGFELDSTTISATSNNLILSSSGQITGSQVLFDGGKIGGFELDSTTISATSNNLILSSSGQITGSQVLFDGGKIGGFDIVGSSATVVDAISSADKNLILSGSGEITGSKVLFDGGKIGGFDIVGSSATVVDAISSADKSLILSGSGQITGSQVLFDGGTIGDWDISSTKLSSTNIALIPGASAQILVGHASTYSSAEIGFKADGSGKIASGNFSWDAAGNVIGAGTWTNSATITGGVFQTATTGQRVVINSSDNTMKFHSDTQENVIIIDDDVTVPLGDGDLVAAGISLFYDEPQGSELGYRKDSYLGLFPGCIAIGNRAGKTENALEISSNNWNWSIYDGEEHLPLSIRMSNYASGSMDNSIYMTGIKVKCTTFATPDVASGESIEVIGYDTYLSVSDNNTNTVVTGFRAKVNSYPTSHIINEAYGFTNSFGSGDIRYAYGAWLYGNATGTGYGVKCSAAGANSYGIYSSVQGMGSSIINGKYAGYFHGNVLIDTKDSYEGKLEVKGRTLVGAISASGKYLSTYNNQTAGRNEISGSTYFTGSVGVTGSLSITGSMTIVGGGYHRYNLHEGDPLDILTLKSPQRAADKAPVLRLTRDDVDFPVDGGIIGKIGFDAWDEDVPTWREYAHIQGVISDLDNVKGEIHTSGSIKMVEGALGVGVTPSSTLGRIDASNDIVAFSTSDIRFKENVTPISDALFKVQQIRGVEFDWIPNEEFHGFEGHDVGVIAQEVEKVLPEVVQIRESGYKAVKYEKIIPLLVEAIKEQQEQINKLEKKVEEL